MQYLHRLFNLLRQYPLLVAGLALLLALVLFSYVGPLFIDPSMASVGKGLPSQRPSAKHLSGTDAQGRDVLAMLILATPQTLKIGLLLAL